MSDPVLLVLVAGAVRLVLLMIMCRMRASRGAGARGGACDGACGGVRVVRMRRGAGPVVIDYGAGGRRLFIYPKASSESGLRRKGER
ncbi:hypothetical protein GCM10017673_23230 [Streptosporangium violaceochromogenes]|nr:hypothetical protein GCM10017673_23230 [Streptosporangium violaceochromogenes]